MLQPTHGQRAQGLTGRAASLIRTCREQADESQPGEKSLHARCNPLFKRCAIGSTPTGHSGMTSCSDPSSTSVTAASGKPGAAINAAPFRWSSVSQGPCRIEASEGRGGRHRGYAGRAAWRTDAALCPAAGPARWLTARLTCGSSSTERRLARSVVVHRASASQSLPSSLTPPQAQVQESRSDPQVLEPRTRSGAEEQADACDSALIDWPHVRGGRLGHGADWLGSAIAAAGSRTSSGVHRGVLLIAWP